MSDTTVMILIFAAWIILQRWVLPKFGIHTCMSPQSSCRTGRKPGDNADKADKNVIEVKRIDPDSL